MEWQLMAQVAWEVYQLRHYITYMFAKTMPKLDKDLKDFLPKVKKGKYTMPKKQSRIEITEKEAQKRIDMSRGAWYAAAGVEVDDKGEPIAGQKFATKLPSSKK